MISTPTPSVTVQAVTAGRSSIVGRPHTHRAGVSTTAVARASSAAPATCAAPWTDHRAAPAASADATTIMAATSSR